MLLDIDEHCMPGRLKMACEDHQKAVMVLKDQ